MTKQKQPHLYKQYVQLTNRNQAQNLGSQGKGGQTQLITEKSQSKHWNFRLAIKISHFKHGQINTYSLNDLNQITSTQILETEIQVVSSIQILEI